jgi:hypothetical protein
MLPEGKVVVDDMSVLVVEGPYGLRRKVYRFRRIRVVVGYRMQRKLLAEAGMSQEDEIEMEVEAMRKMTSRVLERDRTEWVVMVPMFDVAKVVQRSMGS